MRWVALLLAAAAKDAVDAAAEEFFSSKNVSVEVVDDNSTRSNTVELLKTLAGTMGEQQSELKAARESLQAQIQEVEGKYENLNGKLGKHIATLDERRAKGQKENANLDGLKKELAAVQAAQKKSVEAVKTKSAQLDKDLKTKAASVAKVTDEAVKKLDEQIGSTSALQWLMRLLLVAVMVGGGAGALQKIQRWEKSHAH